MNEIALVSMTNLSIVDWDLESISRTLKSQLQNLELPGVCVCVGGIEWVGHISWDYAEFVML